LHAALDTARRFWQTDSVMDGRRRDFLFRNRRWLLLLLFLIGSAGLLLSRARLGAVAARFLSARVGELGGGFWLHAIYGLAAALAGLGAFWRTWGAAYLGTNVVQDEQLHTERLLRDGPFRHTRNPLYLGNLLMILGLGIMVSAVACLIVVLGMWILLRVLIREEEAGLEATQGESYRAYQAAVPRLLPALRARIPAGGVRPHWLEGICGESFPWMFAMATAGLAVTLEPAWYRLRLLWAILIALPLWAWAPPHARKHTRAPSA
jgi:protein-S-isoprenylcysteine O-methyltransferase Ste14